MADARHQPSVVPQDSEVTKHTSLLTREVGQQRESVRICATACAVTFLLLKFTSWIFSTLSVNSPACAYVAVYKVLEDVWMNAVIVYSERLLQHVTDQNMFIIQSVATCSALVWLLFRAWQTLWKPVPELISILGVEVPDPPELSLAGIKSDAITLHWSRPKPHKSVIKYFVQVNGVNVGETSRLETAITVTGLRPGHYYNVRVIAVGSNNFQAGSSVIRLRTYGRNGRPILDIGHGLSSILASDDSINDSDEISSQSQTVCVEPTALPEDLSVTQQEIKASATGVNGMGYRRNGRKHSSSLASSESTNSSIQVIRERKESIHQLTEQLETINREREKMAMEMAKEAEDFKIQLADLCCERNAKKQSLKEKEEASEKLKKEVNYAEKLNRQAQTRKSQKEKLLKEKLAERSKMEDDMKRWKKEIEDMKVEKERWRREKEKGEKRKQIRAMEIKEEIKLRQAVLNSIEEEIRVKGSQIKQLEKHRQRLPGCHDDEESRLRDENEDHEWDITEKAMTAELNAKSQQLREIGTQLQQQQNYLNTLQQRNTVVYHGNSSGLNFEHPSCDQSTTKSCNTLSQNTQKYSRTLQHFALDSLFASSNSVDNASPAFAPGPYIDLIDDNSAAPILDSLDNMTEEDYCMLAAGAPLSPTATSLLPSNIFADDDTISPHSGSIDLSSLSLLAQTNPFESHEPKSPCQSPGLISSPQKPGNAIPTHGISNNDYTENDPALNSPKSSFGPIGSAVSTIQGTNKGFRDLFSLSKPKSKDTDLDGPILGTLKSTQSHSLPRTIEEHTFGNRHRRISFPSGLAGFLQNKASSSRDPTMDFNITSPVQNPNIKRLGHAAFGSGSDDPNMQEINPPSPRPISIASSDLPRPSIDSAPFGWGPAQDNSRNSPLATNWSHRGSKHVSIQQQTTWSSNTTTRNSGSRYGIFPSRFINDDIEGSPLTESCIGHSGQQTTVGAIVTRPLSFHQTTSPPKLNPAAPAFQGVNLNLKYDKENDSNKDKLIAAFDSTNGSAIALKQPDFGLNLASHELVSIATQSICPEFYEKMDRRNSETQSEFEANLNNKDKEGTSLQRLFRKGSSNKFSISSFRSKDSSLFNEKKSGSGPGNSDRTASVERESSIEESSEETPSTSIDVISSNPIMNRNTLGEWKHGRNKDLANAKERKLNKSWGRFGLRGRKGRESLEANFYEEVLVSENEICQ
ncbi:hypothetical protein K3495_g7051 [Podosphaera aphanis]|nr:hypothetical protein K3495_g7051 [Podosphaera aphanis]